MRALRVTAWTGGAIGVGFVAAAAVMFALGGYRIGALYGNEPGIALGFSVVGAVVAARVPRSAIGWLLLGCGLVHASGLLAMQYLRWLGPQQVVSAPGWLAAYAELSWIPGFLVLLTLLPLLFPSGRPLSRRWRPFVAVSLMTMGALLADIATSYRVWPDFPVRNPMYLSSVRWLGGLAGLLVVVSVAAALVSLGVRYRRAARAERLQLRWLAWSSVVALVVLGTEIVTNAHDGVSIAAQFLVVLAIPMSIGVAILRYRLYDIDRIVSRTVSYAVVTGLLVAVYVGCVALTTDLLPFSSSLGVAASTLAVAALFRPVRRRVQAAVDRRFNRARYDATRTVDAFAVQLRDKVDLLDVHSDLLDVVSRTVQPAHASLWVAG